MNLARCRWPGLVITFPESERRRWVFEDRSAIDIQAAREAGERAGREWNEHFWRSFLGDTENT